MCAPASPHPESRTTLIVAHVGATAVVFGALGDSALYLVGRTGYARLDRPRMRFVGYPMSRADVEWAGTFAAVPRPAATDVLAATDGFTDYADTGAALQAAYEAPTASDAAGACVQEAFAGGAGDNVGVAVVRAPR
jgi:serine/threonine protein phosphatase PrpC